MKISKETRKNVGQNLQKKEIVSKLLILIFQKDLKLTNGF